MPCRCAGLRADGDVGAARGPHGTIRGDLGRRLPLLPRYGRGAPVARREAGSGGGRSDRPQRAARHAVVPPVRDRRPRSRGARQVAARYPAATNAAGEETMRGSRRRFIQAALTGACASVLAGGPFGRGLARTLSGRQDDGACRTIDLPPGAFIDDAFLKRLPPGRYRMQVSDANLVLLAATLRPYRTTPVAEGRFHAFTLPG